MRFATDGGKRLLYALIFLVLTVIEVLIALFVHDAFIRPYGGDILITILLCALVRVFLPNGLPLLPLYVFLFSVGVELLQACDFVTRIGLSQNRFVRIILGTSFSYLDLLCYFIGCAAFFGAERWIHHNRRKKSTKIPTALPRE